MSIAPGWNNLCEPPDNRHAMREGNTKIFNWRSFQLNCEQTRNTKHLLDNNFRATASHEGNAMMRSLIRQTMSRRKEFSLFMGFHPILEIWRNRRHLPIIWL